MDLRSALTNAQTIAVVGCSPRATRTSHAIARYLQDAGYQVVPVNPHREELLDETCYPDVTAIPKEVQIDIVNVFRRPEHTPGVVRETAERAENTGQKPLVWTQLGVHHPEAEELAQAADLPYVANRCIMVDHRSLVG